MTRDSMNWRTFYGIGDRGQFKNAQRKYLLKYARQPSTSPSRVAASKALYYALANLVNSSSTSLPISFVRGLAYTSGQSGNTRAGRQLLIERHLLGKGKGNKSDSAAAPLLEAQRAYARLATLPAGNARRVRASSELLRLAARYDDVGLPADFVHGMKHHLLAANKLSAADHRVLLERAARGYYDKHNHARVNSAAAAGNRRPPSTVYHSARSNASSSVYHSARSAGNHRPPPSVSHSARSNASSMYHSARSNAGSSSSSKTKRSIFGRIFARP